MSLAVVDYVSEGHFFYSFALCDWMKLRDFPPYVYPFSSPFLPDAPHLHLSNGERCESSCDSRMRGTLLGEHGRLGGSTDTREAQGITPAPWQPVAAKLSRVWLSCSHRWDALQTETSQKANQSHNNVIDHPPRPIPHPNTLSACLSVFLSPVCLPVFPCLHPSPSITL